MIKNIIVVGIAFFFVIKLPSWSKRLIPKVIDKWEVPGIFRFVVGCAVAYMFSSLGWGTIADSLETALTSLRNIAKTEEMINVLVIPEIVLAILAIALPLTLFTKVFDSIDESKTWKESLISIAVVLTLLYGMSSLWGVIEDYILLNLEGSTQLISTEPFQIIENFFSTPEP